MPGGSHPLRSEPLPSAALGVAVAGTDAEAVDGATERVAVVRRPTLPGRPTLPPHRRRIRRMARRVRTGRRQLAAAAAEALLFSAYGGALLLAAMAVLYVAKLGLGIDMVQDLDMVDDEAMRRLLQ